MQKIANLFVLCEDAVKPRRGSWLVVQKFGRRHAAALDLLLALGSALIVDADGCLQFLLAFLLATQVNEYLSFHIMNIGAARIELTRGIDRGQSLRIFLLPLVSLGESEVRIDH